MHDFYGCVVQVLNYIYSRMAQQYTHEENHRTDTQVDIFLPTPIFDSAIFVIRSQNHVMNGTFWLVPQTLLFFFVYTLSYSHIHQLFCQSFCSSRTA